MKCDKRGLGLAARIQRDQGVEDQPREAGQSQLSEPGRMSAGSSDAGASRMEMRSVPP